MARPRTPTELLELKGTFTKNPSRKREIGPKSDRGLGQVPRHLTEAEADCWREVVANSAACVLTSADRVLVELVARLLAKMRRDWLTGAEIGTLKSCLTELGWTPASRSKVATPKANTTPSEFAEFLQ
jgi:phage terminase small subunit